MFVETLANEAISFRNILTFYYDSPYLCCRLTDGSVHYLHECEDCNYIVIENVRRILTARNLTCVTYTQSELEKDLKVCNRHTGHQYLEV